MAKTCHIIGLGPGLPDYLTKMAIDTLGILDIAIYPHNMSADNRALEIARPYLPSNCQTLPMPILTHTKKRPNYPKSAKQIQAHLNEGKTVGVLCLGDPLLYGSGSYLLTQLQKNHYYCRVVPGITSIGMAASLTQTPLVQGDEKLCILTGGAGLDRIEFHLKQNDTIALLKPNPMYWADLYQLLKKFDRLENSFCIRTNHQKTTTIPLINASKTQCPSYFSTLLILNNPSLLP